MRMLDCGLWIVEEIPLSTIHDPPSTIQESSIVATDSGIPSSTFGVSLITALEGEKSGAAHATCSAKNATTKIIETLFKEVEIRLPIRLTSGLIMDKVCPITPMISSSYDIILLQYMSNFKQLFHY